MIRIDARAQDSFISGQQLAAAGHGKQAREAYRQAVTIDPGFLPAQFALGQSLAAAGQYSLAHSALTAAFDLANGDPKAQAIVLPALADLLSKLQPAAYDGRVERQLLACLDWPTIDPQPMAPFAARLLNLKYPFPRSDLDQLHRDSLWAAILTRLLNVDPGIERRLTSLRRSILLEFGNAAAFPHVAQKQAALIALQAFAGQFVWTVDGEERDMLQCSLHPLLAAMYKPLADFAEPSVANALSKDRLSKLLVQRSYRELVDERTRTVAIPTIAPNDQGDPVSRLVKAQYEEHPYPRWTAPPSPRLMPLRDQISPLVAVNWSILPAATSPNVLIAGCGTGFELAGISLSDPEAHLTAIDLSRASLAHAQRKADELGLRPVRFVQGDLLDVAALGASFDFIFATGVLHHMADPAAGLTALVKVLRPGGLIRVGLYSCRARQPIAQLRDRIANEGRGSSADDIRAFRDMLQEDPGQVPRSILESPDFNSLSGCRDLLFHVHEQAYGTTEAVKLIEGAGLKFIGLEPDRDILAQFQTYYGAAANPSDIELWDQLEAQDPSIFAGMMLLWGQKPG